MATTRGERRDPYGETARFYDLAFELPLRPLRRRALELAPPRPGLRVLDIACGTGSQLVPYARAGARCAGIDRSLAMLRQAGRKLPPTVTLLHGDGTRLPWADASFDLVLTSMSLHEMPPRVRRRLLGEARRVLAADGWALVIDYASREAVAGGRGLLVRGVVYAIEAWAGGRHFDNFRHFRANGGLAPIAEAAGLELAQTVLLGGGNVGVFLLRPV